ncbi:MAG: hypothetical protein ACKVP4_11730 [Hyphomicrobium sp.]
MAACRFGAIGAGLAAILAALAPAHADETGDGLRMSIEVGPDSPGLRRLVVAAEGASYARLTSATADVALTLTASLAPGHARKIVASTLAVQGASEGEAAAAFDGGRVVADFTASRSFAFAAQPDGALARAAIAACNGLAAADRPSKSSRSLSISVPIQWRVTTGRFAFRWTDYDSVTPTEAILANPEFYGERETGEAEVVARIGVDCAPLSSGVVAAPTAAKPSATGAAVVPPKAAIDTARCDGGMARPAGAGPGAGIVCLCPGNTMRVEVGDAAFACRRKLARK